MHSFKIWNFKVQDFGNFSLSPMLMAYDYSHSSIVHAKLYLMGPGGIQDFRKGGL